MIRGDDPNQPGCFQPDDCDIEYYAPAWGPNGRIYFASNLRTPEFVRAASAPHRRRVGPA